MTVSESSAYHPGQAYCTCTIMHCSISPSETITGDTRYKHKHKPSVLTDARHPPKILQCLLALLRFDVVLEVVQRRQSKVYHVVVPSSMACLDLGRHGTPRPIDRQRHIAAYHNVSASIRSFTNRPGTEGVKVEKTEGKAHGVRFRVVPPVGPAVPLSHNVYVLPSCARTCVARPVTTVGVGPR